MKSINRSGAGRRSISSRAKSFLGVGVGAALLLAGVTLVGVLPASATTAVLNFNVEPQSTVVAGQTLNSFSVTITSGGNATDHIVISDASCTFTAGSTLTVAATGGVATFTNVAIKTGTSCTLTATDSDSGGTQPSTAIAVTAGAVTQLAFTTAPPTTAGADTALTTFKVSSEDANGNVATSGADTTDTILISSSCTLGGTLSVPEVAGVATFSAAQINQTGSCILIASDTTNGGISSVASGNIVVSGGTPAKVVFSVAPVTSVTTTDTVIAPFKVAVEDALGNVDTTGVAAGDTITISSTCLAASVSAAAVAGVATFSTVEFATTGTCVLTATDTSRTLTTATATVQVGTPQAPLIVTSTSGYLDAPITLATTGGTGTGAVTYTVTNGTATGCTITGDALSATVAGTCIVTATKAAATPYASVSSVATAVTISSAPKAVRVAGSVTKGKKSVITVSGYNFSGRPKVTSNVAGFKGTVTRDSGKTLTISITVTGASKAGVKVLALAFANGKHATVKYVYHA
jgi:trimeric autotransporter adhesin